MANELLTSDEFYDLQKSAYVNFMYPLYAASISQPIGFYMGKRIIRRDDGMVILFEACEWCGNTSLDKSGNCSKCGGYPTAKTHPTPRPPDEKPAPSKSAFSVREILSRFADWLSAFHR